MIILSLKQEKEETDKRIEKSLQEKDKLNLYLTQSLQEKDNVILSLKKEQDAITPKKEEAITPITPITPKKQEEKIFDV